MVLGKQGAGKYDLLAETAPPIAWDAVQASLFLLQVVRVTAGLAGPKKAAAVNGPCDLNSQEQAAYGVDPQTIGDALTGPWWQCSPAIPPRPP